MNLFFEEPARNFQIREISRKTSLAVTSVKNYLKNLEKNNLIKKDTPAAYDTNYKYNPSALHYQGSCLFTGCESSNASPAYNYND